MTSVTQKLVALFVLVLLLFNFIALFFFVDTELVLEILGLVVLLAVIWILYGSLRRGK